MHEVKVPKLGEEMTETQLIEWVAKEGEKIKERQVLVVLQTEKTSYELEAEHAGILHIISPVDVTLPLGHLIALLAETPEEYEKIKSRGEDSSGD